MLQKLLVLLWKDTNVYLGSCMTESAEIDFESWSWTLQLSGTNTCQFIDNFFAWGAEKESYSCYVLLVLDLEGQRTNHLWTSALLPIGTGLWLLLILLFLSQELPAANSAPVYRHYSHGATLAHNWVTSAQTSWCLPEPPQWLWAITKQ